MSNLGNPRTMAEDVDTRGMDSGNACKHSFEPEWSQNTHVSSQCPVLTAIPKDKREEFITRGNRNYCDGVSNSTMRPPQSQNRNYSSQPSVQHRQPPRTETRQIGGLRTPPDIAPQTPQDPPNSPRENNGGPQRVPLPLRTPNKWM